MNAFRFTSLLLGLLIACQATTPGPSIARPELSSAEPLLVTLAAGGVT